MRNGEKARVEGGARLWVLEVLGGSTGLGKAFGLYLGQSGREESHDMTAILKKEYTECREESKLWQGMVENRVQLENS